MGREPAVEQTGEASTVNAVTTQQAQAPESAAQSEAGQSSQLPYRDALSVVTELHLKMAPEVFADGARVWLRILREQQPNTYGALLQELNQQEQQPA